MTEIDPSEQERQDIRRLYTPPQGAKRRCRISPMMTGPKISQAEAGQGLKDTRLEDPAQDLARTHKFISELEVMAVSCLYKG